MPNLIAFCEKMSGFVDKEGEVDVLYLAFHPCLHSILAILVRMLWSKWLGSQKGKKLVA